ncbi:MAG TPA: glycine betaine ABC transporter substrate-binding protein [Cyclobacteriaceae bacterium]|nr:glycine betaine ABC transporter substrate-binding protein [Cyclobacteriaceae bacterium]
MKRAVAIIFIMGWIIPFLPSSSQNNDRITVGAKHFNEGYILGEMIALLLEDAGYRVDRRFNLGGTAVTFEGLLKGAIDIYPEYTGTISTEILRLEKAQSLDNLKAMVLEKYNLELSNPYGFENSYALLMKKEKAQKFNIERISDLPREAGLRFGISHEFLERQDGWQVLAQNYGLPQRPLALEHGLAYQAILEGKIDVMDAYSTDGEISRYDLLLLEDDRNFFPEYHAVSFYRSELPQKAKETVAKLSSIISAEEMQELNALALFGKQNHITIAHNFLLQKHLIRHQEIKNAAEWRDIMSKILVHLQLTVLAVAFAIIIALPLGLYLYRHPHFSNTILYIVGIMQTVPSIALLALMIPLFGIGKIPALVALFLYALLPILRNTLIGLFTVDPQLKLVAAAIGLNPWQRLKLIELPLAIPAILAGIRTASVITVGTATLAAFIGAGGLGEFIVTGLALNNTSLILKGAIPSALLAVVIELLFEELEKWMVPAHLRQKT